MSKGFAGFLRASEKASLIYQKKIFHFFIIYGIQLKITVTVAIAVVNLRAFAVVTVTHSFIFPGSPDFL